MKLESELHFRLSLAADFLESQWKGDVFVHAHLPEKPPSQKVHLTHTLQAISLLTSLSEFLGRNNLRQIANDANTLMSTFTNGDSKFIIHDEKSLLVWNSLACIIALKQNKLDDATQFAKSIVECIGDDTVSSVYPPDFSEEPGWYAEAMLALILTSAKTKDEYLADYAAYIGNLLLGRGVVPNHLEAWGFTLLYEIEPDSRYLKRARRQVQEFKKPAVKAMPALFAACAQQAFFASYPHYQWLASDRNRANLLHREILNQQIDLQIDPNKNFNWVVPQFYGAFVLRKTSPKIRLDYVVQNCFALMQYISHLRGEKILAIV